VSIGNDVVDLADPETSLSGLHARFDERVFSATERGRLEASGSRHRLHWAYWAAKESAYKALKRLAPEAVFSPREFEVDLSPLPVAGAAAFAAGWVHHRGRRFCLEVRQDGESVHAVARSADAAGAGVLWKVDRAVDDPGVAVRRLAAGEIGSALCLDPAGLRIVGRPPVAMHRDRRLEADVSLSHHGRFVAFACTLDQ
jgi:phosphopantetheinyl transferase (holo-ACP synthase)